MKHDHRSFDRDLAVLLKRARVVPLLPEVVRARVLARARVTAVTLAEPARRRGS